MKRGKRNGEVLAHVAGPSGAGKTELMNRLAREIDNVELKDLDEYDDLAVEQLGWTGIDKNDYTDEMLDRLHVTRQKLIDEDIKRIKQPIIFFGHAVEGDNETYLPTKRRIMLDVDPARSAVRVARRPGRSLKDVKEAYRIAKEDREYLLNQGYDPEKPAAVYNELKRLAQKNPGLLEAVARLGTALGGANAALDLQSKLQARGIIGKGRKVQKSKRRRRNGVSQAEVLSVDESGVALIAINGKVSAWARTDAGWTCTGVYDQTESGIGAETTLTDEEERETVAAVEAIEVVNFPAGHFSEPNPKRRNPSFTVNVDVPGVRESVDVKALTTGGALRVGRRKLRAATKVKPRWTVEKNPDNLLSGLLPDGTTVEFASNWPDNPSCPRCNQYNALLAGRYTGDGFVYRCRNCELEVFIPDVALGENPHRRNRKTLPVVTLVNRERTSKGLRPYSAKTVSSLYPFNGLKFTVNAYNLGDAKTKAQTEAMRRYGPEVSAVITGEKRANGKQRNGKLSRAVRGKLDSLAGMFHGKDNPNAGKTREAVASSRVRGGALMRLGNLPAIKPLDRVANGRAHDGHDHACKECAILFNPSRSFVGMTTGKKLALLGEGVHSVGRQYRTQLLRENPALDGHDIDLGPVDVLWYVTPEKHANGKGRMVHYYHNHGEETGRVEDKPSLMLDTDGMFYLAGGNYTVTEAGICN